MVNGNPPFAQVAKNFGFGRRRGVDKPAEWPCALKTTYFSEMAKLLLPYDVPEEVRIMSDQTITIELQ